MPNDDDHSLISQYREMAADGVHFPGFAILSHKDEIRHLVRKYKAVTLLDYGCGRGEQYKAPHRLHRHWGMQWWHVKLYDPAFPAHDERPYGKHDIVLCSDVLEHVPESELEQVIGDLFLFADKAIWASVCCRPAKKTFPGTDVNLHVTLKPMVWWEQRFTEMRSSMGLETPFILAETQ
jgi:hypothetical protein